MKELVKPNHVEARYEEVEAFDVNIELAKRCLIDRSCDTRNRCRSGNSAGAEVMDEILF